MARVLWIFLIVSTNGVAYAQPFKIMPLGNSITQSDLGNLSYRYYLSELLKAQGIDFDYVGSENTHNGGTPSYPQPFDPDHEGHWGWYANELRDDLPSWLGSYTPDIVLMHVGSNDAFATSGHDTASTLAELEQIIDILRADNPNVIIFLAQLIPTTDAGRNSRVNLLNAQIPNIQASKSTVASPIYLVDQNTGFDPVADTYDGVHPVMSGDMKMAQKWFDAMIVPLPIKLSSFKAEAGVAKINIVWSTASEKNNHFFTVQHSRDGNKFYTIAEVEGAGNSTTQLHYNIDHDQPTWGANYYRLKQTDFDGKITFSDVIVVHYSDKGAPSIYPNPVVDNWVVDFSKEEPPDERLIQLFDLTGRKLFEYKSDGETILTFKRNIIANGTYILRINSRKHNSIVRKMTFQ